MKRALAVLGFITLLPGLALAQSFGEEFMLNWDLNEDGKVTAAEVQERRRDLFYMFDQDEDGRLNDEEYDLFDETRTADRQAHLEAYGLRPRQGQAQGKGRGQQQMQGQGRGMHFAAGIETVQNSFTRRFNDLNGDNIVTQEEFVSNGENWFARMDKTGDGVVTLSDFNF